MTLLGLPPVAEAQALKSVLQRQADSSPAFQTADYLTIVGADNVVISDTLGNSTALISGEVYGTVPNVTTYTLGENANKAIMPPSGEYTVALNTTTTPLAITVTIRTPSLTSPAIRYVDASQPSVSPPKYDSSRHHRTAFCRYEQRWVFCAHRKSHG